MGNMTSLYLCNRTVCAAVGRSARQRVRVDNACWTELPEGCLINGMITDEAVLAAALKAFFHDNALPTKNVGLVLNGSQFLHRLLTLPAMTQRQRYTVIGRELDAGSEALQPLDDYMQISRDAHAHTDTILATRVEKSVIDTYMALAAGVGLTVTSIDLALGAQIKLVKWIPELADKTFICLVFDGDNVYSSLYVQGQYQYSTRNRLLCPRNTPGSGAEVLQRIAGILQFHFNNKGRAAITHVYFAGDAAPELAGCAAGLADLQLTGALFPDAPQRVLLPPGQTLAPLCFTVGNLIDR